MLKKNDKTAICVAHSAICVATSGFLCDMFGHISQMPQIFNLGLGMGSMAPGLMSKAIKKNNVVVLESNGSTEASDSSAEIIYKSSMKDIIEAIESMDYEDISFLKLGIDMNLKVAEQGLRNTLGIGVGYCQDEFSSLIFRSATSRKI